MFGLGIHTSSPQLGLMLQGVNPSGKLVSRHQVWDLGRAVSSQLHVKMMAFIEPYRWQDLSFVAVAKGPGGFTGTRVGVVAARTLAQQLAVPLFGISALAAMAAIAERKPGQDIAVTMPAKRGAIFGGIYRWTGADDLTAVRADEVVPAATWDEIVANWPVTTVPVSADFAANTAESVRGVMALAQARWALGERPEWSSVMPFYGQHPVDPR
ncbi:MAG: tRNA (adenosine(37)-N6)-threonylcarbamoyltransferase complex dimerization subunit type 1 TsaB [Cyanobacteria bacterium J06632_3]